jgi:inositol transport system substrate-binding protein
MYPTQEMAMTGNRGTLKMVFLFVMLVALLAGCVAPAAPAAAPAEGEAPAAEAPAAEAPAAEAAAGDTIQIGVSVANFDDTFLTYMRDGMAEFAATLPDAELITVDAKEDVATQLNQVENFITQGVDAIVLVPVNTEATGPMIEAVQEAGIPLVFVNRLPAGLPDDVVFVGSESIDAGIFQMEWIAEQIGGEGNVVIMMGKLDNEAAVKRTEGVEQVAAQFPGITITKKDTANWSRAEGLTLMENWLATGDPIAAVASNNDDMALGALEAIEAAGLLGEIIVGGVDATPDALAEMEAGRLDVTVFQDAAGQGGGSIDAAYKLAKGEAVENRVWIPFQLVTQENLADFQN